MTWETVATETLATTTHSHSLHALSKKRARLKAAPARARDAWYFAGGMIVNYGAGGVMVKITPLNVLSGKRAFVARYAVGLSRRDVKKITFTTIMDIFYQY